MIDFIKRLNPFFITLFLFFGGLDYYNFFLLTVVVVWFTFFFYLLARKRQTIEFPPGFFLYLVFLLFFALNLFWSKDFIQTYWFLLIFSCGVFFWLSAYNLNDEFKDFEKIVILLGLIFGGLAVITIYKSPHFIDGYSLHRMASESHHHMGDFWAVILAIAVAKLISGSKKKLLWLTMIAVGLYIIFISKSRTSLLSLGVGVLYIFKNLRLEKKYWYSFLSYFSLAIILFLVFAKTKPFFMNRIYYLQGIVGIFRNPLGVGVGNFRFLSSDPANFIFGFNTYSAVADNIILEMFAGMGILGIIFLFWFLKILDSVQKNQTNKNLVARVIFIAMTTSFMFYFSYFIPTTLWIWFISLGLSQKKISKNKL